MVAQTRRLHFAKKLIDETTLPMTQIAVAAGFGSVRRFNAAIKKTYRRTPTQIRQLVRQAVQPENQYLFRLRYRPPFDWDAMLAFLAPRATPGVEAVEHGCYRRSISLKGSNGFFEASLDEASYSLTVRVQFPDPSALFYIIERIRAMFDLNADWPRIVRSLRADPVLRERIESHPGLRVVGCWNGFELATRAILGQQITVQGATERVGQLVKALGRPLPGAGNVTYLFPSPETLANVDLSRMGVPRARAEAIRALARAVAEGHISFDRIADIDKFLARLSEIRGIGKWTAQYVSMRALGDPDAFPSGDAGLLHASGLKSARELELRSDAWRPWRAYAAMYLWSAA
jgi:AraC family transcriptional regulator of adaptative response / DNA-3-methyladenine glycosylase II